MLFIRSNDSKSVLSDELKAKIQSWNRADSSLFDAVNSTFWVKIAEYGVDKMDMQVKELRLGLHEPFSKLSFPVTVVQKT